RKVYYGDSSPKSPCVAKFLANSLYHIALRFWTFFLTLSRTAMLSGRQGLLIIYDAPKFSCKICFKCLLPKKNVLNPHGCDCVA
ncbi:MAG: hypothetical protein PHT84_02835, partial [Candidatus Pacebacteria bacterium]|nr:hypothetical protein [Candidatus Paceibacterota bacterium]